MVPGFWKNVFNIDPLLMFFREKKLKKYDADENLVAREVPQEDT